MFNLELLKIMPAQILLLTKASRLNVIIIYKGCQRIHTTQELQASIALLTIAGLDSYSIFKEKYFWDENRSGRIARQFDFKYV